MDELPVPLSIQSTLIARPESRCVRSRPIGVIQRAETSPPVASERAFHLCWGARSSDIFPNTFPKTFLKKNVFLTFPPPYSPTHRTHRRGSDAYAGLNSMRSGCSRPSSRAGGGVGGGPPPGRGGGVGHAPGGGAGGQGGSSRPASRSHQNNLATAPHPMIAGHMGTGGSGSGGLAPPRMPSPGAAELPSLQGGAGGDVGGGGLSRPPTSGVRR